MPQPNTEKKCCELCRSKSLPGACMEVMTKTPCPCHEKVKEWKPCSCPKGGQYSDGSICDKCHGTEWIEKAPLPQEKKCEDCELVKEGCYGEKHYHCHGEICEIPPCEKHPLPQESEGGWGMKWEKMMKQLMFTIEHGEYRGTLAHYDDCRRQLDIIYQLFTDTLKSQAQEIYELVEGKLEEIANETTDLCENSQALKNRVIEKFSSLQQQLKNKYKL